MKVPAYAESEIKFAPIRRSVFHLPARANFIEKAACFRKPLFLVEGDGFEPSKSLTTDLQSAPFGHSGTPPNWSW